MQAARISRDTAVIHLKYGRKYTPNTRPVEPAPSIETAPPAHAQRHQIRPWIQAMIRLKYGRLNTRGNTRMIRSEYTHPRYTSRDTDAYQFNTRSEIRHRNTHSDTRAIRTWIRGSNTQSDTRLIRDEYKANTRRGAPEPAYYTVSCETRPAKYARNADAIRY